MENDSPIHISQISQAVQVIKTAVLQSQIRTVKNVNSDVLALYYSVGGFISENSRKQKWGSGAIKAISDQLQKELPGLRGFGESNIKNMRQFYEEWSGSVFRQPMAGETQATEIVQDEIRQPTATQIALPILQTKFLSTAFDVQTAHDFLSISFTHHMEMNKAYVEFVIQKYDSPMGVATYKTSDDMPENLRKALPDIEDLKRLLSNDIN